MSFWFQYVSFIQHSIKDIALVRAKFESRRTSLSADRVDDLVELMLENALFEEEQNQVQKTRKIYETIVNEIAPGHIKSIMASVGFERRAGNNERAKDLYFKAFANSLSSQDPLAITFIAIHYSRFVSFSTNDPNRAVDILDTATDAVTDSKVLYLSKVNLLKHLEGLSLLQPKEFNGASKLPSTRVTQVYELAMKSNMNASDMKDVAISFIEYLRENCQSIGAIREMERKLVDQGILTEVPSMEFASDAKLGGTLLGKRTRLE